MRIFISIASYRDPLLKYTITEAYNNAKYPDSLIFSIVEQEDECNALDVENLKFKNQIRYVRIEPEQSRGCCWARNIAQTMYEGEEFFLQIDSHMAFDQDWDEWMVSNLKHLMQYHDKPIITLYPRTLKAKDDDIVNNPLEKNDKPDTHTSALVVNRDIAFTDQKCLIRCQGVSLNRTQEYSHGFLIAAGFLFTLGQAVDDVPYDPHMFYSSEEPSMALRYWTHGYSIFHTSNAPIYHYYGNKYRKTFSDKEDEGKRTCHWNTHDSRSTNRFEQLVRGVDIGVYGTGRVRTLQQYVNWSGIDYSRQHVRHAPNGAEYPFTLDYKQPIFQRKPIDTVQGLTLSGGGSTGINLSGGMIL